VLSSAPLALPPGNGSYVTPLDTSGWFVEVQLKVPTAVAREMSSHIRGSLVWRAAQKAELTVLMAEQSL
jgi:hypothetical protein